MGTTTGPAAFIKWIFLGVLTGMLACSLFIGSGLRGSFGYVTTKGALFIDGCQNIQYHCLLVEGHSPQEALDSIARRYQLEYTPTDRLLSR